MGTRSRLTTRALPLMSVEKGFARHFTFYKNYLGFAYDVEGRPTTVSTSPDSPSPSQHHESKIAAIHGWHES